MRLKKDEKNEQKDDSWFWVKKKNILKKTKKTKKGMKKGDFETKIIFKKMIKKDQKRRKKRGFWDEKKMMNVFGHGKSP